MKHIPATLLFILLMGSIQCRATVYVNQNSTGPIHDGKSWATAYLTIREGVDNANVGEEVWVTAGSYNEYVYVPEFTSLFGGFSGNETSPNQRNLPNSTTLIDGRGIQLRSQSVLDGFTSQHCSSGIVCNPGAEVRNCIVQDNGGVSGAGIFSGAGGSLRIVNCTIRRNGISPNSPGTLWYNGAGIQVGNQSVEGELEIDNSRIEGNGATFYNSGGIYCRGTARVTNSQIINNTAVSGCAGIQVDGTLYIENCTISGNSTASDGTSGIWTTSGGGLIISKCRITRNSPGCTISWSGSRHLISNTVFSDNSGSQMIALGQPSKIINCTLVNDQFGALVQGNSLLSNCILSNNSGTSWNAGYVNCLWFSSSATPPSWVGTNRNIQDDPQFADPAHKDYHLLPTSPCIDAGDNSVYGIDSTDLDGEPRILDGNSDGFACVDMGCYEFAINPKQMKTLPDNKIVNPGYLAVTATFPDRFYVEDKRKASGIGVIGTGYSVGDVVSISGITTTVNDERLIQPTSFLKFSDSLFLIPMAMPNRAVGGSATGLQSGITGGSGLNNIGLLITTWGKVIEIEPVNPPAKPTWFVIDDGSGCPVECLVPNGVNVNGSWTFATVTGISSLERDGNELRRLLRMRKQGDIVGR